MTRELRGDGRVHERPMRGVNNAAPIRYVLSCIALGAVVGLGGCALPERRLAVPLELQEQASVAGLPGIRYVVGGDMSEFMHEGRDSVKRERALLAGAGHTTALPPANFLALSGGGDDGAFGAGLLCGWTEAGTRPVFKVVTGISTGALIAPFAFLGSRYDAQLREVYTNISSKDILEARWALAAAFDDAVADNAPLFRLTAKHVTEATLKDIAAEYAAGRLLLVATTNLDARRAVIWNMTKIAASGHPNALELFHRIMVASAAIPGTFPPVMMDVETGGVTYQEMHVDGGAMAQVFIYPPGFKLKEQAAAAGTQRERRLYVVRNARLDPDWADVERRALTIAQRAITSLIHTQGIGDVVQIYAIAERDGLDYNLAYIPPSFKAKHREDFDTAYMRQLFQLGYDLAAKGYPWLKKPPEF
ncbi:MAG: patatin-like phospholipase family protein [Gammaproteobacteria bacterium]